MSTGMTKSERLRRLEELYFVRAFSDIEMANHLKKEQRWNVDRTTIYRDRTQMEGELGIPFVEEVPGEGKWKIDRTKYISNIRLNPNEALSLYLSARRATQQTRIAQRYAASALERLAIALRQPMSEQLVKAADTILAQKIDNNRLKIFEEIAKAWIEGRPLNLTYRGLEAEESKKHRFHTFLIEPATWSDSVYVIGYSELFSKVTPLKLERIERASISSGELIKLDTFDEQTMLAHAWGVWNSGRKPIPVKLRFAAGPAAKRLRESIWHPLEKVDEEIIDGKPTGNYIWQAEIAEPREMIPFIRSWGADCEVIEPAWLRRDLQETVQNLASLYQIKNVTEATEATGATTAPYLYLWAKADKKTYEIHRLIYHLIDVGQSALVLWQSALPAILKQRITDWLHLGIDDAGRLIAFWASLHDLGKASPAFQDHPSLPRSLRGMIRRDLKGANYQIPNRTDGESRARHEVISAWELHVGETLAKKSKIDSLLAGLVAQAIGGHHGSWPDTNRVKGEDRGDARWATTRSELVDELVKIFKPPALTGYQSDTLPDNIALTYIGAIISVADWLGSDDENFPLEREFLPLPVYQRHAGKHAQLSLLRTRWQNVPMMPRFDFQQAFTFPPNQAQVQAISTLKDVPLPAIVIVENGMGTGKTEIGFGGYAHWSSSMGQAGLYIAMPTTATSNQMHLRTKKFLTRLFGKEIDPLLVHSQALLREIPEEIEQVEENEGDLAAGQNWFLPRKKSLLSPFGVGTVDQALMGILQTKHFFVRLMGLSNKVVIFDEVHAYDAYMSELFERLLCWLRQLNTSVIILSATLPEKTRNRLLSAYSGNQQAPPSIPYPRLTFAGANNQIAATHLTPPDEKTLRFEWLNRDEESLIAHLRYELRNGGCAAVICNTVGQAQSLYQVVANLEDKLCEDEHLILFHARFPLAWREDIETSVLEKFGPGEDKAKPNPKRPYKSIVVATQVIEQSLDLDFDVMISDHAPLDLLLQRAGRLHRHDVNKPTRQHSYQIWIAQPEVTEQIPRFTRGDTYVYDEYVLLRSWIVLQAIHSKTIRLPTDLSNETGCLNVIEQVYGDKELETTQELQAVLAKTKQAMDNDTFGMRSKARKRLVVKPNNDQLLWGDIEELEEDDPSVHEIFQALTRADRPGLNVACLHRIDGQLSTEPDGTGIVYRPSDKLEKSLIRELARHTVNIKRLDITQALLADPSDPMIKAILTRWKKVAALRYHRVVIFENGVYPLDGQPSMLRLNKQDKLGLEIVNKEKK